jgi:hypothetical protein
MNEKTPIYISPEAKKKLIRLAEVESKARGTKTKGFQLVEVWIANEYAKLDEEKK